MERLGLLTLNGKPVAPSWTGNYPLWHAQYTTATTPNLSLGWNSYVLWQYASNGQMAGVPGDVDLNRLGKTLIELQGMFGGAPVIALTRDQVLDVLVANWRATHPGR